MKIIKTDIDLCNIPILKLHPFKSDMIILYKVKLKDFPVDPTSFAKVLDFCYENKSDPDLIDKLKSDRLTNPDNMLAFSGEFYSTICSLLVASFIWRYARF